MSTDLHPAPNQQTQTKKQEPNFAFSFLHSIASLLRSRLRRRVPPVLQLTAVECGAACLAMIMSYYGRQTRVTEIRESYGIGRDGLSALDIIKAARSYGMRGRAISIRGRIDELRFVSFPAIVYWEFNHFMVIERWSAKYVDMVDPAVGRKRLSREEFELGFTGVVIMLEPGEQFDRHVASPRKLTLSSYITQYFKRAPMTLVQLLVSSLCLQIFGLGVPILTKVIIDRIIPLSLTSIVPILSIFVLSLCLAQLVIMVLRAFLLTYLQYRIDMYTYPNFFDHLFMLPLKFFQQRSTGDILTRVSSNNTIRDIVSTQFLSTILDGSLVVVYLLILLWQSWLFALVVLILGILQLAFLLGANNEYRLRSARELETIGKSQGYVAEILAGITTVKAAGAEQRVFQWWFNLFSDQLSASLRRSYLASFLSMSINLLRIVSPLLLLWLGVIQVLNGTMPLGTMIALNSLAGAFITPLASLASSVTQLPIICSHLERLSDVMEADIEQDAMQAQEAPRLTGRIQLQDVSFKHDTNSAPVLKGITIDIAPGQKIAIVGPTGSGKSTLGKLLLGLYLPTEGEILYDGIPLRSLNYQSVRSQFGVIMQDASIFSGSIRHNIAFNNPGMNMESIIKAAKLAALDGDIQQMPMGYETYVTEAGNTLSGGQCQRLAIARALANNPSILLLDEATSALDVITEQIIAQNLKSLSCTQIIIAHRLSTVREADVILVLDQGSIVESGSHAELLAKDGHYAKLIYNQLATHHSRKRIVKRGNIKAPSQKSGTHPLENSLENPRQKRYDKSSSANLPQDIEKIHIKDTGSIKEDIEITTEQIDDFVVLLTLMKQMDLPTILDRQIKRYHQQQGISWGWTACIWLAHIISQGDHRKLTVRNWVRQAYSTLKEVTELEIRETDFTDNRLTIVLRYLSEESRWQSIEQDLEKHLIKIYDLQEEPLRVDVTTAPKMSLSLADAVREEYHVEHGFGRFNKAPLSIAPMFVQRDDQGAGLTHLLSLAERVLTLMEFVVRRSLKAREQKVVGLYKDSPRKATATPTAERLLQAFVPITITKIYYPDRIVCYVTHLNPLQQYILALLGFPPDLYSSLARTCPRILPTSFALRE